MAVVFIRSNLLTNTATIPPIQNASTVEGGRHRTTAGIFVCTTGDSIGSTYRICRVMPHWRMQSIRMFNQAITATTATLGLYRTEADGGAVVAASAYGSAVNLAAASVTGTELMFSSRTVDKLANLIWQDAGYQQDPKLALELVITLTAAAGATGNVCFDVAYVVD